MTCGTDTISPDRVGSVDFPVHRALLGRDILSLENLANLGKVKGLVFTLSCFPLKFEDPDGSPIRAVAIVDECGGDDARKE